MKGKSLRRALETSDSIRIGADLPLIQDTTELITPDVAKEMLLRNKNNRPANWQAVDKFAEIMKSGGWQLHPQGIILDRDGNIITGQTRLMAVLMSGASIYMRVSRGARPETAFVIDRGRPQSARDLSSRRTERKHSPSEASLARCISVLRGISKPTTDDIGSILTEKNTLLQALIQATKGMKKTKSILMVMGAFAFLSNEIRLVSAFADQIVAAADQLEARLLPYTAGSCWGKGAAFGMALHHAMEIVKACKTKMMESEKHA